MALALLRRRQGRVLLRALSIANTDLGSGAFLRPTEELGASDSSAEVCSTSSSHQHGPVFTSSWSRTAQRRQYGVNNSPSIRYVPVEEPSFDDLADSEPTTYTQLLSSIRSAKHLKRLQHLVSIYSDRFDAVHVAAAVARLPRLIQYRAADLVEGAVPQPSAPHLRLPPRRKQRAALRASHLEAGAKLAAQLDTMLLSHASHFFPRQAACSIWAFGELRHRGVIDRMASLPDVLLAATKADLQPLRVHGHGVDLAQLVQGLAKLGFADAGLMAALAGLVRERLGDLQQIELQMVAWGLAQAGHADEALFRAIAQQMLATGTAFLLPSGCGAVFWAFAKAGMASETKLFDALAGGLTGQALLVAPSDVATVLWASYALGYRNHRLFHTLGDALLRELGSASDQQVASALESLARLRYSHPPLMDRVAAEVLKQPMVGTEDPTSLARVIFAFGRLQRCGPQDAQAVARLAEALSRRLPVVREAQLAMACEGLLPYGYKDQAVLSSFSLHAERMLSRCSAQDLLPVLRLLGAAGAPHFQLAVAAARHVATDVVPGGRYRYVRQVVELLYRAVRQGVDDAGAAEAVLRLAAEHEAELRPKDAARLVVIGQAMNLKDPLLGRMAEAVRGAPELLDADTAQAAEAAARALGDTALAAALAGRQQMEAQA
ncbi:hypothetical protein HYH03_015678 [Edaphochlamys debaryana]|uniref:RNA-editing substrate-binding complex 6 protein domain-containing protein n=1 Tax=Edaphochlamys debaryana TaxID=47281 RepID=A0A835XRG4_9CHLO|nr:hypothetical protein HYH03_015678 [Edaphochlamys debaryana]|eukprot:KAG2485615.1 hypothetical protein HYH03_015678 [Edaphochlamys debaryana]